MRGRYALPVRAESACGAITAYTDAKIGWCSSLTAAAGLIGFFDGLVSGVNGDRFRLTTTTLYVASNVSFRLNNEYMRLY